MASAGRPSQESVDRRAQTCTSCLAGGPVDRPGRSQRASALWKGPVDRAVNRTESLLSVSRPRSTGRSTDRPTWLPTASFSSPINWGFWGLFSTRFEVNFYNSFSYSFKRFSPLILEAIFPIKRGVYQECLKDIFLSFPPPSLSLFSHTNT